MPNTKRKTCRTCGKSCGYLVDYCGETKGDPKTKGVCLNIKRCKQCFKGDLKFCHHCGRIIGGHNTIDGEWYQKGVYHIFGHCCSD